MATVYNSAVFDDDDYYDLTAEEEALLCQLDTQVSPPPPTKTTAASSFADSTLFETPRSHVSATYSPGASSRAYKPDPRRDPPAVGPASASASVANNVLYPDLTEALSKLPDPPKPVDTPDEEPAPDLSRPEPSALARFRAFPKKPFSVSDFTSGGAWCELQYYYTLTRLPFGRKTRTAAMKAGSKVHKKLEDEVHTTVKVDIVSKEDIFGLKLWNVVQGLRTLRDTGLTREMEVWGFVDGHLTTGIIDSLSYSCPHEEFEEEILASQESQDGAKPRPPKTIYLADVKTRGSKRPPTSPAMLRPTRIQLFLYHRFLSEMIAGKLNFFRVLRRLDIDADEPFSDEFIAQVGALHDEIFYDADADADASQDLSDGDPSPDLIKYKCIRELLQLLQEELRITFSDGTAELGQLVSVDYRYREDGSIIGTNTFPVDDEALGLHLESDMEWWKGEREPRGVDIEEAFKCGYCEFASVCEWRGQMEDERLRHAREKIAAAGRGH